MTITIEQTKTLADAIRTEDEAQLKAHGWLAVKKVLGEVGAKRFGYDDLLTYAYVLGDCPPADILEAIRQAILSGSTNGHRPSVAQVSQHLRRTARTTTMKLSPWQEPKALELVLKLHADGVNACDCGGAIFYYASTALYRCQECGGLDVGQLEDAEEARA
jgi:hypothetical protein